MPRLTKTERELRDTIAECTVLENSCNHWRNKSECAEKEIAAKTEQVEYWIGRERVKAQECEQYRGEIKRMVDKVESLQAVIGRICLDKGMVR